MTAATEIKPDGSWTRALTLGSAVEFSGSSGAGPTKDKAAAARMAAAKTEAQVQAIKKQFLVPSGPGWTVTRQRDDEQMTLVVRRTAPLAPGETVRQDMVVRGIVNGQPGGQVVNEVAVRPAGPARVEYRETLRWQGKRPDELFQPQPSILKTVRAALPAPLAADDKAVSAITVQVQQELWRAAFGPGEPLIVIFLAHPDLGQRRMQQRLGRALVSALETNFGDRMTPAERRAVALKLATNKSLLKSGPAGQANAAAGSAAASGVPPGADPSAGGAIQFGGKDGYNPSLVALTFTLKPPGRVVETNGEYDELTGEVVWTLYTEAVAAGDVTLRAVCETPGAAAANQRPAATSLAAR